MRTRLRSRQVNSLIFFLINIKLPDYCPVPGGVGAGQRAVHCGPAAAPRGGAQEVAAGPGRGRGRVQRGRGHGEADGSLFQGGQ